MPNPVRPDDAHDQAEELLPWYATGQLDEADRALVERHLSSCEACQKQLSGEHVLIDQFRSLDLKVASGWAKLRAQIAPQPRRQSRFADGIRESWDFLSRPAVAAFATAQLAFVVLAGGALLSLSRPSYHALGGTSVGPTANVIVIFRADATEQDVREALRSSGASLVGGPTPADAYLLHVPANRRASALAKLQSDDDVQMAEPIDGPGQ
jgi:predicted anti-sigma-YlaC factor YlaD